MTSEGKDSTEDKELETPRGSNSAGAERKAAAGDLSQNEGCLSRELLDVPEKDAVLGQSQSSRKGAPQSEPR